MLSFKPLTAGVKAGAKALGPVKVEKASEKTGATAAAALLGSRATKEQKRMKLQLCNEQC